MLFSFSGGHGLPGRGSPSLGYRGALIYLGSNATACCYILALGLLFFCDSNNLLPGEFTLETEPARDSCRGPHLCSFVSATGPN